MAVVFIVLGESTKVVIPLVLAVIVSLSLVFVLLVRHTRETVVNLNTAALQLEAKRLYHLCEKAVEELIVDRKFNIPASMNIKKDVVLFLITSPGSSLGLVTLRAAP